jgi:hypothetical protein
LAIGDGGATVSDATQEPSSAAAGASASKALGGSIVPSPSKVRLPLMVGVLAVLGCYVWFGPTAMRQARWMAEARERVPEVEALLQSDQRFADCKVGVSTGGGLLVVGRVRSREHLRDLQRQLDPIRVSGGTACVVRVE